MFALARSVLSGLVVAGGLLSGPVVAAEPAGTIRGTVTVGDDLKPRPMRFSLQPDVLHESRRARADRAPDERRNVVVYLERAPVPLDHQPTRHAMEQRDGRFVPHVLPVMRGARVAFPNSDPLLHHVYSLSKAASFDLGRFPRGRVREVDFNTPGLVRVGCHDHSDMAALILVLDNPFFARPDADGRFRIDGVPPGDYTIVAWHERATPARGRLHVEPGRAARVDFHVPLAQAKIR